MRGVFERPKGSRVFWISYFVDGKHHREKVGRKSDAITLYQTRKAETRAGVLLAPKKSVKGGVTLGELIDDALKYVEDHNHKDKRNYLIKAKIVREALGDRKASSLTPQQIDEWLRSHCKTPATANRYRAFFSLAYREGKTNRRVTQNPTRDLRHRKEPKGRERFLSKEECATLHGIIAAAYPERLSEFVVSVHTGMRQGEQFSFTWNQVDFTRKTIRLVDTKNGESRTVHLNKVALGALESIKPQDARGTDPAFPDEDTRQWFNECLETAKIEDYTWHNNRHTFGSWLAMAGASTKEIQESGGWKSIQMAARYSHLSPVHTASVVDRLI